MADPALFEFLHTEMVAELWAQDPDPGPGVSAGSWDRRPACWSWRAWASAWARPWARGERRAGPTVGSLPGQTGGEGASLHTGSRAGLLPVPYPGAPQAWPPRCLPQAAPGDANLQGRAGHPQVPVQRPVGGCVPQADGQPPYQPPGDLRPAGQQLPPPCSDGLGSAVPGGSAQVPGLHLRPPAWHPQHPGRQEPGHRLRGSPARL
ncbi:trafficking protein particle complex subunit 6A isoform X1 [Bos taurus]|uniref:trafficking protein particle complex subunit 6A isoform X1 n=1 Tax=Bos taurus TaxID=9913 RepID=UPI000572CFE8|nr:trafficking protein particle complex subunit 6A isoform X1 [Bos taurus]